MDEQAWRRLEGLERLLHESVNEGSRFVEKHHRHAAEKPFRILESIGPIAAPSRLVHRIHDGVLTLSYGGVRTVNQLLRAAGSLLLHRLEPTPRADAGDPPPRRD